MVEAVRKARPEYLAQAMLIISLSFFARGLRWRVFIGAKRPFAPLTSFWTIMVGYLGNSFLPARAGDIIRPALTVRAAGTSMGYSLAALLTERIMDTVALVVMSLVASLSITALPGWLHDATRAMAALCLLGMVGLLFVPRVEPVLGAILARLPLREPFRVRLIGLLHEFFLGMRTLQRAGSALRFMGLTTLIWLLDTLTVMETARALYVTLHWQWAMLLLVALGLASIVPSTPGYVGIYQFVAVTVLVPFGLPHAQALAFITVFQAVNYVAVIVWGAVGIRCLARRYPARAEIIEATA